MYVCVCMFGLFSRRHPVVFKDVFPCRGTSKSLIPNPVQFSRGGKRITFDGLDIDLCVYVSEHAIDPPSFLHKCALMCGWRFFVV